MNKLILIKDSLENKISYYLLAALLITLPFDRFYSQLFLAAFIVHSLIFINRQKIKQAMRLPVLLAIIPGSLYNSQSYFYQQAKDKTGIQATCFNGGRRLDHNAYRTGLFPGQK